MIYDILFIAGLVKLWGNPIALISYLLYGWFVSCGKSNGLEMFKDDRASLTRHVYICLALDIIGYIVVFFFI